MLACDASETFAKRMCSSRAARSSGIIRSTSICVLAAIALVQSCWMRTSVGFNTLVGYRTKGDLGDTVKSVHLAWRMLAHPSGLTKLHNS